MRRTNLPTPSATPKRSAIAGLFLLAAFLPCLHAVGEEPYEKVLFASYSVENGRTYGTPGKVDLVPLHYLAPDFDADRAGIELPAERIDGFLSQLDEVVEGGRGRCVPSPEAGKYSPSLPPAEIGEVVQANDVALLGTVEYVMPAWDFTYGGPGRLVFLRVDEVLRDTGGDFSIGDLVTFEQPFGTYEVRGAQFCVTEPANAFEPSLGGRALVVGLTDSNNQNHLWAPDAFIFDVVGEKIVAGRYEHYQGDTLSLSNLRQILE